MKDESVDKLSFEEAYKELEKTLQRMEENDVPLEEALSLFKEGVKLYKRCKSLVESAELTVKDVLKELEEGESEDGAFGTF